MTKLDKCILHGCKGKMEVIKDTSNTRITICNKCETMVVEPKNKVIVEGR